MGAPLSNVVKPMGSVEEWLRHIAARPSKPQRAEGVAIVAGSAAGARCGVNDYSLRLGESLTGLGLPLSLLPIEDWSVRGTLRAAGALRALRPSLIHLQYPTLAYGRSLGPHLLAALAGRPLVVTLHEYTAFGAAKRAALGLFAMQARHIVFTTRHERAQFLAQFPQCRARSSVVPIGSNIPRRPRGPIEARQLAFFGQLRPGRGLEAVIALARHAVGQGADWQFLVIGSAMPDHAAYLERLRNETAGLPLRWQIDLAPEAVADALARSAAIYLPYPDGVSERRGSLMAALDNAVPVVTTDGPYRPPGLERAVRFAATPAEAFGLIAEMWETPAAADALAAAGRRYVQRHAWSDIAAAHRRLYHSLGALPEGRAA